MKKSSKGFLKFFIIAGVISLLYITIVRYLFPYIVSDTLCGKEKQFAAIDLDGVVVDKYIDKKNHAAEVLLIKTKEDLKINLYLAGDSSSLYKSTLVGDSIFKSSGAMIVKLKKGDKSFNYKVAFGCNEFKPEKFYDNN